ncbi:DNA polymerase III subunit delta', partial [Streptomyces sp. 2MCAF27]
MAVWDDLVGQDRVASQLTAAARDADTLVTAAASAASEGRSAGAGSEPPASPEAPPAASKMTHAWLFTGPP